MSTGFSRRRFLAISAAALLPGTARAGAPVTRWQGVALGAPARMSLVGLEASAAAPLFAALEHEIARLEGLFSLYRPGSALRRLNHNGRLDSPPAELLELLSLAGDIHHATGGAFDPTIQPLWLLHAAAAGRRPDRRQVAETRWRCGWQHLDFSPEAVVFTRPGMAVTLNGIAQGYIADRMADLLRRRGLTDVLIDMGEIAALGRRPGATPWRAAIALPDGEIVSRIELSDRALATSAPLGTLLDRAGQVGHILDPRDGRPGGRWQVASVSARQAALADGLSTAFCLLPRRAIATALARYPDAALEALV